MRFACLAAAIATALVLSVSAAVALKVEENIIYRAVNEKSVLQIISTADRKVFEPIIIAFQKDHPEITVDYTITGTSDLMKAIYEEGLVFDLAISSAMDLQTKLANDGFAQKYRSEATDQMPGWAKWRNQIFAFTQEPAVLVVSKKYFTRTDAPASREELITLLRDEPDRFRGRIGTYDVRTSGFGYLMATQDSRNSDSFWRLMEVMGGLDTKLYCCSSDMLRDISTGDLALAYNVLGSYADSQLETNKGIFIIEFGDFVNVMLRSVLIPKSAKNIADARVMVDYLVRLNTKPDVVAASGLPAIDSQELLANNALRPIRFGPGLLVFLDKLKRENFLRSWGSSIRQE